jgi:redox-sensitive bicupin YhaK (pirin superfamily)
MEILSYVLEGALRHQDSMGTGSVISPGDVQRMTAGTGILHSEKNASDTEAVHFLQMWVQPARQRLQPGYEQRAFPVKDRTGRLTLIASLDGREGSITIHQDVNLYSAALGTGDRATLPIKHGRYLWAQVARGRVRVNDSELSAGDGAALAEESAAELEATAPAEVLLFDLA